MLNQAKNPGLNLTTRLPVDPGSIPPQIRASVLILLLWICFVVPTGSAGIPVPSGETLPGVFAGASPDLLREADGGTTVGNGINNTGLVPSDVTSADFNGDGLIDLVITYAFDDALEYYINLGGGQFELTATLDVGVNNGPFNDLPRQTVARDFDKDGFLDIAVVCSGNPSTVPALVTGPTVGILYGYSGGFEPFRKIEIKTNVKMVEFSSILISGYLDQDSLPDLVVGHHNSSGISLLYNLGNRNWDSSEQILVNIPEKMGPEDLRLIDLNQDGGDELIITTENSIQIWRGNVFDGFPNQVTVMQGTSFTGSDVADLNGNSLWDLVVIDGGADVIRILMDLTHAGEVSRGYDIQLKEEDAPIDLVIYDANLDGIDDVGIVNQAADMANIYLGGAHDDIALPPISLVDEFQTSRRPRSMGHADLNGDQKPDLIVVNDGDACCGVDNQDINIIYNNYDVSLEPVMRGFSASTPGLQLSVYLDRPRGLAWDSTRQCLWTLDRRARELIKLDDEGRLLKRVPFSNIERPGIPIVDPVDITVDTEGRLWVADRLGGKIIRVPLNDGSDPGFSFFVDHAVPGNPTGIAFDSGSGLLYSGSEGRPQILAYTLDGALAKVDAVNPVRGMAWNPLDNTLWFIPENSSGTIRFFMTNGGIVDPVEFQSPIALTDIASIMNVDSGRSIAIDPAGGRFWLLTDSGLLVQTDMANPEAIRSVTELRLLRDICAVAGEGSGGLILGDSGLLGTLVKTSSAGEVTGLIRLNAFDNEHPLRISGLCSDGDIIGVLDGRNRRICILDKAGNPISRFGAEFLASRRPAGILRDQASGHMLVGLAGRIAEFRHDPVTGNPPVTGQAVFLHDLPANVRPSSLTGRPGVTHGLSIYSAHRGVVMFLDGNFQLDGILSRTQNFPPDMFVNAYAIPGIDDSFGLDGNVNRLDPGTDVWVAVGRGETNLVSSNLVKPRSAAAPVWLQLP